MPLNDRLCDRRSLLHHFFSFFSKTRLCSARRLTANGKLKIFRGTSEELLHRPRCFLAADLESIDVRPIDTLLLAAPSRTLSDDVSRCNNAFDLHVLDPTQDQLLAIRSFIRNGLIFLLYFLTILQDSSI